MKRMIRVSLTILCVTVLSLSFVACNGTQSDSESEGLDSPTFSLNGVEYTLPVSVVELIENGWDGEDFDLAALAADTLNPHTSINIYLKNEDQVVGVDISNSSARVLPISESYVSDIFVSGSWPDAAQLIFPGNIMVGSTYEDVIAAYGKPNERNEWSRSKTLTFFTDDVSIELVIDTETNLVMIMGMRVI